MSGLAILSVILVAFSTVTSAVGVSGYFLVKHE